MDSWDQKNQGQFWDIYNIYLQYLQELTSGPEGISVSTMKQNQSPSNGLGGKGH